MQAVPQIEELELATVKNSSAAIDSPVFVGRQQAVRFGKTTIQNSTRLRGQTLPTFRTTAFDNETARLSPHSSPEPMGLGPLAIVGAKCRLHKS